MAAKNACLLSFVTAAAVSCEITYADAAPAKPPVVMLYVGAYPEGPDNKGLPAPADLAEPFVAARNPQGNSAFTNIEIYYAL